MTSRAPAIGLFALALAPAAVGLFVLVLAGGCGGGPAAFNPLPSRPKPILVLPPLPRASLIALGDLPGAITLGPRSRVTLDRAIANGGATVDAGGALAGRFDVLGDVALGAGVALDGPLTAGGAIRLAPRATASVRVSEHAPLTATELPSSDQLLARMPDVDFGDPAPDVRVADGAALVLPPGGSRLDALELGAGATVIVNQPVDLEVTGHVLVGADAQIVVRDGGRLRLHLLGHLALGARASIVQGENPAPGALALILGPAASASVGADTTFGPGLLYAPASALDASDPALPAAGLARFRGAIVARRVATAPGAALELDARFLLCPFDRVAPSVTLTRGSGGAERLVAPGTRAVAVSGAVTDDAELASATLSDALGTAPLTLGAGGVFSTTARLRADGDPTTVCIDAVDCAGHRTEQCTLVAVRHDVELAFTSPRPGEILAVDRVSITGRVSGGALARVEAGGVVGHTRDGAFTIPRVPLAPGLNLVAVRATAASGEVAVRRLLVSSGPMPAVALDLAVGADRRVTIARRRAHAPLAFAPPSNGPIVYRLLDADGAELYRGHVPGTIAASWHVDGATQPRGAPRGYHTQVIVPAPATPTQIEFLDEEGARIGHDAL